MLGAACRCAVCSTGRWPEPMLRMPWLCSFGHQGMSAPLPWDPELLQKPRHEDWPQDPYAPGWEISPQCCPWRRERCEFSCTFWHFKISITWLGCSLSASTRNVLNCCLCVVASCVQYMHDFQEARTLDIRSRFLVKVSLLLVLLSYGSRNNSYHCPGIEVLAWQVWQLIITHGCWLMCCFLLGTCTYIRDTRSVSIRRANNCHCESSAIPFTFVLKSVARN